MASPPRTIKRASPTEPPDAAFEWPLAVLSSPLVGHIRAVHSWNHRQEINSAFIRHGYKKACLCPVPIIILTYSYHISHIPIYRIIISIFNNDFDEACAGTTPQKPSTGHPDTTAAVTTRRIASIGLYCQEIKRPMVLQVAPRHNAAVTDRTG